MKRKLSVAIIIALFAVLAGASYWQVRNHEDADNAVVLYGNVEVRDAQLAFTEQELVSEVLVEEGDTVVAGQVLARLRSHQLRNRLDEAQARLDARRQIVRRLENGSRKQEIEQARSEVNVEQVRVDNARASLQRLEQTAAIGASSRQALDDARASFDVKLAQLEVARQNLALLREGPREEEIKQAQAELTARRAQLNLLRERLEDSALKAPFDGVIQSRILEPGEMAGPTKPAFILARTDPKWIRAYVPEPSLGLIREGMSAEVFCDTWPDRAFSGQVGFISSVAEFTPKAVETTDLRTKLVYEVRVLVADPENELRLGMPVTVEMADVSAK